MRFLQRIALMAAVGYLAVLQPMQVGAEELKSALVGVSSSISGFVPVSVGEAASASGFERGVVVMPPDPCRTRDLAASPSRPYWDAGAATTPCGNVEADFGVVLQPMGDGVRQRLLVSSVRYGLTPRMDLRWGATNHIAQSGGGLEPMEGIGDESLSVTYRFHEQGRRSPAMALSYGITLPKADPEKGFGSGFRDHQFVFIASRDLGATHVDFNIVGTLEGEEEGNEGAVQFGMALTRPLTRRLAWILESYGGPQPGTTDRFGAVSTGGSFALRPWLVLDGAFARTYTSGSPRQQILFGVTCARRSGFAPIARGSRIGRLLGR